MLYGGSGGMGGMRPDCPGDAKKLWEAAAALGRGETHDDMREDSQGVFG